MRRQTVTMANVNLTEYQRLCVGVPSGFATAIIAETVRSDLRIPSRPGAATSRLKDAAMATLSSTAREIPSRAATVITAAVGMPAMAFTIVAVTVKIHPETIR